MEKSRENQPRKKARTEAKFSSKKDAAPGLAELQQWMRWVVTDSRGVSAALRRPRGEPQPRRLGAIVDAEPLTKVERLDVYAEGYYSRLLECLEQDYPTLARVLGEDIFRGLIAEYLEAYPSKSYTAAVLGRHLPEFLKTYALSEELPYLPDLAALEWATIDSYFAKDVMSFELSRLGTIKEEEWPSVVLSLDSSVVFLHSRWNVDAMWADENQPALEQERWLVVFRRDYKVRVEPLEPLQYEVLWMIREGLDLSEICTRLEGLVDIEASEPPLMKWFRAWMETGLIKNIRTVENQ